MDKTKQNETRMLPLLERVLGFKAIILFLVSFFSIFDLHSFLLISTYSKGFSWKIWPTLAKFQEKNQIVRFFTMHSNNEEYKMIFNFFYFHN
jgi:hypothetical protein